MKISLFTRLTITLPLLLLIAACEENRTSTPDNAAPDPASWEVVLTNQALGMENIGRTIFIALSPVNEDTVWAAGMTVYPPVFGDGNSRITYPSYARTIDGGSGWKMGRVPGTDGLEFRDVEAFDGSTALMLAAGEGAGSRIYRTEDAGATWTETFRMDHPEGFINCFDFWDEDRGILFGDTIDGGMWVATTSDGGRSWARIPPDRLPEPIGVEGGYAASGTCVSVRGTGEAWIATSEQRILATADSGKSWSAVPIPFEGSASIAVRSDDLGYLVSGNQDDLFSRNQDDSIRTAVSRDGGQSWSVSGQLPMSRNANAVAWLPDPTVEVLFASGPTGIAWSIDAGESWKSLSTEPRWALDFGSNRVGWAVGYPGYVIRIDIEDGTGR